MAYAIMMISDEGPAIGMHVTWGDDASATCDLKSPAHQHMQLLIKAMDTIAQRIPDSEPLPTAVTVARLHAAIETEERKAIADGTAQPMFGMREMPDDNHRPPH
jgi:hypothetical protein